MCTPSGFPVCVAKKMVKIYVVLAALLVSGTAVPVPQDETPIIIDDTSAFFDDTVTNAARIIGGDIAPNGAYPWMAAMLTRFAGSFFCGGSILNIRYVLTAAHCIDGVTIGPYVQLRVGTNQWGGGGLQYSIEHAVMHEHYNPSTVKHDIGLLRTSSIINLNAANVRAIVLSGNRIGANIPCRVSGWGVTNTGTTATQLLELRTTTMDGNQCRTEMARVASANNIRVPAVDPAIELCTFLVMHRGNCHGDSGGPLVRNSNNQQIGVVSWGLPCARGAPDIYVRVSEYLAWIQRHT